MLGVSDSKDLKDMVPALHLSLLRRKHTQVKQLQGNVGLRARVGVPGSHEAF